MRKSYLLWPVEKTGASRAGFTHSTCRMAHHHRSLSLLTLLELLAPSLSCLSPLQSPFLRRGGHGGRRRWHQRSPPRSGRRTRWLRRQEGRSPLHLLVLLLSTVNLRLVLLNSTMHPRVQTAMKVQCHRLFVVRSSSGSWYFLVPLSMRIILLRAQEYPVTKYSTYHQEKF